MNWLRIRPEPEPLNPAQIERGQRWIIRCSVVSMMFAAALNDRIVSLFVLRLDPSVSDATLAFFFALAPASAVLTALMSPLIDLRGKKRLMIPFYLADVPFLLLLTALAWAASRWSPRLMVGATAAVLTGYAVTRSLGFAGWFPLINDNVPEKSRGRFFGRLRTSWQLMFIVCTASTGIILGESPALWRFQALFAVAAVSNLAMTLGMTAIPEAPVTPSPGSGNMWRRLAVPFHDRAFVNFLVFGALYNIGLSMAGPFALRCLKQTLGAGDNFVVWMDTLAAVGAATMLAVWGHFVDRFGSRPLFSMLIPPLALANGLWLVVGPGHAHWPHVVAAYSVLHGLLVAGIGVGITDMMLDSAMAGHRSAYINISFVINTMAAGIGPFLGTWAARSLGGLEWTAGPVVFDANRWVFVARALVMLVPLAMIDRLSRKHGGHVGESLQRMSAHIRGLLPTWRADGR